MRLWRTGTVVLGLTGVLALGGAAGAQQPRNALTGMDTDLAARVIASQQQPSTEKERTSSPLPPDPARRIEYVRPRDLDPASARFLKDHLVVTRSDVKPNGRLLVFFPGTFGRPNNNQWVLEAAALEGYRAIGLEYVNTTDDPLKSSLVQICGQSGDPDCPTAIRSARWFGGDGGQGVSVTPADAALHRLVLLLRHLDKAHPGEGWGSFLQGEDLDCSRVVVGGHSQGGGMAAFIAKRKPVARVLLMSGGPDATGGDYAAWVKAPGVTPPERWYAMAHEREPGFTGMLRGFAVLGAKGAAASVDKATPATRVFTVATPPRAGGLGDPAHGSVAADQVTPLDANGRAAFLPTWRRMMRIEP